MKKAAPTKAKLVKKAKPKKMYFVFDIVKFDSTGNKKLEQHKMTVQRQSQSSAVTVVRKKYNPKNGYFEELYRKYSK